jgi:hypothetical protein
VKVHLGSTTTLLDASGLISGACERYDVWGSYTPWLGHVIGLSVRMRGSDPRIVE